MVHHWPQKQTRTFLPPYTSIFTGSGFCHTFVRDGLVKGTWKRVMKKKEIVVRTHPIGKLSKEETHALHAAAKQYGLFSSTRVSIE